MRVNFFVRFFTMSLCGAGATVDISKGRTKPHKPLEGSENPIVEHWSACDEVAFADWMDDGLAFLILLMSRITDHSQRYGRN
jgi:hypothetical protein